MFFTQHTTPVRYHILVLNVSLPPRRRLQRIKLNGNGPRARSCLPFTRTLALVKIVPTWISSSSPVFHGCRSPIPPPLPLFTPPCFVPERRFNPGFSTRFDTLHSGLYALTRLTQHGTPCSYYCSYDPPILDRFILFHPRFSHYLVQPLSTTPYPFLFWCLPPFSHPLSVQAISELWTNREESSRGW